MIAHHTRLMTAQPATTIAAVAFSNPGATLRSPLDSAVLAALTTALCQPRPPARSEWAARSRLAKKWT